MIRKTGIWLGGAALLLLSACMQKDQDPDPAGPGGTGTEVGKAEILLPALPQGFLLKAAPSGGAADPYFILTISGPGMAPRKHAWPLSSAGGTAVTVENIPAGSRLFTGEIEAGGGIVYADSVWTAIEPGRTALVRLKLGRTSGNAKVCVEIEGLPPPTGCAPPDSLPNVAGCWAVNGLATDSAQPPRARILQRDSTLQAVLTWPAGGWIDTARGYVTSTGYVYLDGDFVFSGVFLPGPYTLSGKFQRRLGSLPAQPVTLTSCDSALPPVDSALACYDVAQDLDKRAASGRFTVMQQGEALYGHFQWTGYPGMPVSGKAAPISAIHGKVGYYLYGNLPAGMARDPLVSDGAHYKAQAAGDGTLQAGTIYGTDGAMVLRGTWKGSRTVCQARDRELIRSLYGF